MPKTERDPFAEILALEARIKDAEVAQSLDIAALRKELKEVKEQITELIELITAVKGFVKFIGYVEKMLAFLTKWAAIVGATYAAYKFGIMEIAEKVKQAGK